MYSSYTTNYGDTFDIISLKVYGNERYASEIIQSNPELRSSVIFEYGVKVKIPEIKIQDSSILPPWKKE